MMLGALQVLLTRLLRNVYVVEESTKQITIGTHDGCFHADEAFAIAMLKLLPRYKDATIVRTRDPAKLAPCDIVVDVGGEYDPARNRYDHHQRDFTHSLSTIDHTKSYKTKLSSAGLVYTHFGRKILSHLTGYKETDKILEILFEKMYREHVEEYDGIDNGIAPYKGGESNYAVCSTVFARVGRLVPAWNCEKPDYDGQFAKAVALVESEFLSKLDSLQNGWLPARDIVKKAVDNRLSVDSSGEIIVLEKSCPWKSHLYDMEKSMESENVNIKYVLYADNSGCWRVQCVSLNENSFENRLSLPNSWRGVRDAELSKLTGIPGCIFVHASGFIGGNKTKEGALAMAKASLNFSFVI